MNRLPLSLIAHWAGGELHGEDLVIEAITQDTRALVPGSLYVALRGERFDGHDFAADALARGAAALLVERLLELPGAAQVQVADWSPDARARELGLAWHIDRSPRLGLDVDLPADLDEDA